jgi:LuxR family maltose regulon positive regulatory protein
MRQHALRGRADLCTAVERKLDAMSAEFEGRQWGVLGPSVELQTGLARAYASIARRDWTASLDRLDQLAPAAERLRQGRDGIQIYLLRALAAGRCGKDGSRLLDEAVSTARMWGLKRVVSDTHPDLEGLVRQLRGGVESGSGQVQAGTESRLADEAATKSASTRARAARGSLLSPKEREVLGLLARNMSNKQIALAMGVSDETIKWHFKNLFRKLNAGSRSHLLQRARMVGVFE